MPLVVDGVQIPIDADVSESSFRNAKSQIDELRSSWNNEVKSLQKRIKALDDGTLSTKIATKAQQDYRRSLNEAREAAERLQQVGVMASVTGAAILAPMILAAKKFVDTASENDQVAQDWKRSMASLEESSNRAGRIVASELNPALQTTAKLVSQLVGFLEQNPEIAGAAAAVGGGLITLGSLISVAATVERTVATLKGLTAAGGMAAPGTAGGALMSSAQIAVIAAAVLAVTRAEGELAAKAFGDKWGPVIADVLTAGLASASKNLIDFAFGKKEGTSTGSPGAITPPSTRRRDLIDEEKTAKQNAAVNNYRKQFEADLADAQKKVSEAQQKIADTEREGAQRRLEIVMQYEMKKQQVLTDLARQNAEALANYNRAREQAIRDTEREIENIRRASQKRLREMEKQHNQNVYDLTAARDALGLAKENKRYSDEVAQEEENTREEIALRREALKEKLRDLARSYQDELRQRQQAAAEKLKLLAQERDRQLALEAQKQAALNKIVVDAFNQLVNELKKIFGSALNTSGGGTYTGGGGGVTRRRAAGGYATDGVYRLGEIGREFVLNAATTRRLEQQMGGNLSQQSFMNGMTVNINLGNNGTITQFRKIVAQTKAEIVSEFASALGAA